MSIGIFGGNGQDAKCFKKLYGDEHPITLYTDDINDTEFLKGVISQKLDYLINFAAITKISQSNEQSKKTLLTNTAAVGDMLNLIKTYSPKTKFFSAGSIEEQGDDNVYAISKQATAKLVKLFREKYGLFAIHGILSHHYDENSKSSLVVRKITKWAAETAENLKNHDPVSPLEIGNLESKITVIPAKEVCQGIWSALNYKAARDWTFSSRMKVSIREILEYSMEYFNIKYIRLYNLHPLTGNDAEYCLFHKAFVPLVRINPDFYQDRREYYQDIWVSDTEQNLGWKASSDWKAVISPILDSEIPF